MVHSFMALLLEVVEERKVNVPDNEIWLIFVKYGYILSGDIPTLRAVNFEKDFIREPGEY